MTSQTQKAKAKLAALSASLDDLETHLEPLFAQTLPETVLGLEPIQQAKLQTVLPYLVYDLVFSACHIPPCSLSINPEFIT
jgi:exosome complex protein LRP1